MKFLRAASWKYALGELAIVVVGILLAVQVDRRVQQRAEPATLREHLDNLVADLEADSATLHAAIEYETSSMNAADSILKWMDGGSAPANARLVETANRIGAAGPILRRGTYQAILSTGALGTIEDGAFRNSITHYYENFPGTQLRVIVEYHSTYNLNPLPALLDRHLDPRSRYRGSADFAEIPLFVTSWDRLAEDEDLKRQLRTASSGNLAVTPYFAAVAEAARRLRLEAIASGGWAGGT